MLRGSGLVGNSTGLVWYQWLATFSDFSCHCLRGSSVFIHFFSLYSIREFVRTQKQPTGKRIANIGIRLCTHFRWTVSGWHDSRDQRKNRRVDSLSSKCCSSLSLFSSDCHWTVLSSLFPGLMVFLVCACLILHLTWMSLANSLANVPEILISFFFFSALIFSIYFHSTSSGVMPHLVAVPFRVTQPFDTISSCISTRFVFAFCNL